MKRKAIFITLIVASLITVFYGCKKSFLDTLPTGSANDALLANEKGVNAILIGAYAALDGQINGTDGTGWASSVTNWVWGDVASDDGTKGSDITDQSTIVPVENYSVDATNGYVVNAWRFYYAGIARANAVLKELAKVNPALPDATTNSIKAQAMFIRAFIHFQAKKVYNNIPYIKETDDPIKVVNTIDAWPLLEADLQFAAANLPASQTDVGRPTKYAAEAVLAYVYLFEKKFTAAKPLLDDIIASGKYSLMPNFSDNFLAAKRNNAESVFEIQYSVNDGADGSPNAGWGDALNFPVDIDGTGTCCGFHQPTQNLVNAFQVDATGLPIAVTTGTPPNFKNDMGILSTANFVQDTVTLVDPRLDYTVGRRGVPYLDWGIMRGSTWIRDQSNAGPYLNKKNMFLKKDKGALSTTTGWATGVNSNSYRAITYGHILLWRAEVAAQLNDLSTATSLVNQVRARAGNQVLMGRCRTFILPNQTGLKVDLTAPAANYMVAQYPATFANQAYALTAIQTELRLEFAMEGFRHFDLVRWGIAATTINAYLAQDRLFRSLFGGVAPASFTANKNEYWPLPSVQVSLQPGVLTQNSGY
jgi:starch-binding outer membrane protein, SusD/RagB family